MGRLLNIYEAAEVSGLSERQLRRKLASPEGVSGARKDGRGRWLIPEEGAADLRTLSPRLSAEEKSLALELREEDPKITAKEVAGEINRLRKQRGERRTSKDAVEKFLRRTGGADEPGGERRETPADPALSGILEQMQSPEFLSALLEGRPPPSDLLDLRGLSEEEQDELRGLFDLMDHVLENAPGGDIQDLPGGAHELVRAAEQKALRSLIGRVEAGLKRELEAGMPLGINYVLERRRQREARRGAVQKEVEEAIAAAERAVESLSPRGAENQVRDE